MATVLQFTEQTIAAAERSIAEQTAKRAFLTAMAASLPDGLTKDSYLSHVEKSEARAAILTLELAAAKSVEAAEKDEAVRRA